MKKTNLFKKVLGNRYVQLGLVAAAGIFAGWLFFHHPAKVETMEVPVASETQGTVWTCAMHPQIRMDAPGKCPICGMDLIPLTRDTAGIDQGAIRMSREAVALANVMTSVVSRRHPVKEVRLYGKVQADERLLQNQVAHIPGRIDKLLVNFTGETVTRGQTLAMIYSPELVTAQQELLEAARTKAQQPAIYEAAKEKLRLWKVTDDQIASIEKEGAVRTTFDIVSNTSGIVTARRVNIGDYVSQGTVLFDVADLSDVWVMFDAYESDLPFLKQGDNVVFTVQAVPGRSYAGRIAFIDPVVDPVTRVARVRVEVGNGSGILKPEMFASGTVEANLTAYRDNLVIPRSAVLWTGKRSIVYVKQPGQDEPVFSLREIGLGPRLGNSYVVESGLQDGEEIVTEGTFSVDAAAQLEGKPSMMSPAGGQTASMPGMTMPSGSATAAAPARTSPKPALSRADFAVSGNCDMCKERIEQAAKSVGGVSVAIWDANTGNIHVEFDRSKTGPDEIGQAIARAGHDNGKFRADDKTYEALPACCKYRDN